MQWAYVLLILSIGFFAGMSVLIIYRSHQEAKKIVNKIQFEKDEDKEQSVY